MHYTGADWKATFNVVLEAEDDTATAIAAIKRLELEAKKSQHSPLLSSNINSQQLKMPSPMQPAFPQLAALEDDLMSSASELCTWRWIVSTAPTLDKLRDVNCRLYEPYVRHRNMGTVYCTGRHLKLWLP
jgi:hypothetical protein